MKIHKFTIKSPLTPACRQAGPLCKRGDVILALGAESAGNFSVFSPLSFRTERSGERNPLELGNNTNGVYTMSKGSPPRTMRGRNDKNKKVGDDIYFSDNFGDLLDENNFKKFQKAVLNFLNKNKIKPNVILTDLHPLYKTTLWGAELSKKYRAKHIQIQHHLAHIFSAIGEKQINLYHPEQSEGSRDSSACGLRMTNCFGLALDGTGYGTDGKIWGGEIFLVKSQKSKVKSINRIAHLENQIMIGADSAVREPARMLISILAKTPPLVKGAGGIFRLAKNKTPGLQKDFIYSFVKKYYTKNQFELLYNQLQNNFNCVETSSTGRVLDAVSVLLGFCKNKRDYKHEPIDLLEKNSATPYAGLKPKLIENYNKELRIMNYELCTTYLFEYLIKNINKDKKRLAATAQFYIAEGLYEIMKKQENRKTEKQIFIAGGISNNKIISSCLESRGAFVHPAKSAFSDPASQEFNGVPRGDAGISFGQIIANLFL